MVTGRARWAVPVLALALLFTVTGGIAVVLPRSQVVACARPADHPDWSVARRWDESLLDAIRRALPAPTVHARNLFHVRPRRGTLGLRMTPRRRGVFVSE